MKINIRRKLLIVDERQEVMGRADGAPLVKVAVVSIVENPLVDRFEVDLKPLISASRELGEEMAARAVPALAGHEAQSYGKAGLVGVRGEQEHANALLTTIFADPFRKAIGGAGAWISSMTKVGGPGTLIDVPMNSIHDVYVRSHYDGMSLVIPDAPLPDEIAIMFCFATRGRLNARVGGLTYDEASRRASAIRMPA